MEKALFCKACGAQLTQPLILRSGKDPSVPKPEFDVRMPLANRGSVYKSYEPLTPSYGGEQQPLDFVPQHWVNPDDLTEIVGLTRNRRRLGGCCGIGGISGPNQVCRCGAEIGTLQDDCCTPYVFVPVPAATEWAPWPEGIRTVMP